MQKMVLQQSVKQRLSPQQIQFTALLQLSHGDMQSHIDKELTENPVLEQKEGVDEPSSEELRKLYEEATGGQGDGGRYGYYNHSLLQRVEARPLPTRASWQDDLLHQLELLSLKADEVVIGKHIIGSLDEDGYLRRSVKGIVDDMAFMYYMDTSCAEVEGVLGSIQGFCPAGVGARSVQECLLLQLRREEVTPVVELGIEVVRGYFELFSKRRYEKIIDGLGVVDRELFRRALVLITRLNPKPIAGGGGVEVTTVFPDFIVTKRQGGLEVMLAHERDAKLRINRSYVDLVLDGDKARGAEGEEALAFVKQKIARAQWFIQAVKQRKKTLLRTMETIVDLQRVFFEGGEEGFLKPMFLRDVADRISMNISTVSRIISQKAVQTDWGVYPLKYFFSEPIDTISGEKVSSRLIKGLIMDLVRGEDKVEPLSDQRLTDEIRGEGYLVARRTVTKYREKLNIPIARLRKGI